MDKKDITIRGCSFKNDQGGLICSFTFGGAKYVTTTIRIVLDHKQIDSMIITNITTLPFHKTMHGYGSRALQSLLSRAVKNDIKKIVAVQVQKYCEEFWIKNGFKKVGNETNDFIFVQ